MHILAFLGQAMMWIAGAFIARWIIIKVFIIGCLVVVLPWVLKNGVTWFWEVSDTARGQIAQYANNILSPLLAGIDPNIVINITSIGGYIANQIGLVDYASILVTAFGICWGFKIGQRYL